MMPRDIFFLAVGVIIGIALQSKGAHGVTCACFDCERNRWKEGKPLLKDAGLPPFKPHNIMWSDMPACCRRAKKEGLDAQALHAELGEHDEPIKPYPDRLGQLIEQERGCVPPLAKANPLATNIQRYP